MTDAVRMFNLKKLSWKIALIVFTACLIVGGTLAFYFEYRLISTMTRLEELSLKTQTDDASDLSNQFFSNTFLMSIRRAISLVAGLVFWMRIVKVSKLILKIAVCLCIKF